MASVLDSPEIRQRTLRLSVDQYHKMCESGIIDERTELLSGIVVAKMGKSPIHTWSVRFLLDWLEPQIDELHHVRQEQPLTLVDSEPEPDLAVVAGTPDDFRLEHPNSALLVVEVAVSSEDVDRQKAVMYASARIAEYWIVFPEHGIVTVHTQPSETGYSQIVEHTANAELTPSSIPAAPLELDDLFPTESD